MHGHLIPQIFLLHFVTRLLFAPTGITTGSCEVKQLSLIAFENPSGKSAFPWNECQVRSKNDKPYEWGFSREVPDRSNGDNDLDLEIREHLRSSTPSLTPLVAARLLVFMVNMLAGERMEI